MFADFWTFVEVAGEEDACDETVEDARQQQRHQVEDDDVGEVVDQVLLAGQFEGAHLHRSVAAVVDGLCGGQTQPRTGVAAGEGPDSDDDLLGPLHCAHTLGLHRVADGNVTLHREGRQRQR